MSNPSMMALLTDVQQGHHMVSTQVWPFIKDKLSQGLRLHLKLVEADDPRSLKQLRCYWGVVLKTISDQANLGGTRYSTEAWHELYKRQILGYKIDKFSVAGLKRKQVRRRLRSTGDLTVNQMSTYLEQVQAHAATELGVRFPAPDWQTWDSRLQARMQTRLTPDPLTIDNDTGEILY